MIELVKVRKDVLWKSIIEDLFEDFLRFFYPDFVKEIDFSKEFEFLDKELEQLYPASANINRRADLLVKVHLKNGNEQWLLIHIEVQGYRDKEFNLRMFIYNYRSFDRYKRPIVALAILTDDSASYRPAFYEYETWGTKLRYDFKMYKLLDHKTSDFEKSKNPFASVMQTARSAIKNKKLKTDQDLLRLKMRLFRNMYRKGHTKETIQKITNFIKYYVTFEKVDFYSKFEKEVNHITKNQKNMGILEVIKQELLKRAKEIGKEEGEAKGIEIGEAKGIKKGEAKGIEIGKTEGLKKAIRALLSKSYSEESIIDILDVSKELINIVKYENEKHDEIIAMLQTEKTVIEIGEVLGISETYIKMIKISLTEPND